ncbi:PIR protein, putative [Plasmodium sp. gorilla clade G1]|nr:PIR protein, putative [Plasmodium sp. gorilla clade G1]
MKVHYFNILLIALPLNILVISPQKNPSITQKIPTTRLLCECELYSTVNYDNDSQMKSVINNFNKQTQQRLHEYDERMKTIRQECKEQCDKEIQKIILKDKLEKELMDKFATLHTDIQSDAIPTCVCEKSIADKMEKGCLRCGQNLGGIVPGLGLIGGAALYSINVWKPAAIKAAIKFSTKEGIKAGIQGVIAEIKIHPFFRSLSNIQWLKFIKESNYNTVNGLVDAVNAAIKSTGETCESTNQSFYQVCDGILANSDMWFSPFAEAGKKYAASTTATVQKAALDTIESTTTTCTTVITTSVIAILIIVLVMVIIYLILRYRRKKKMKKKLQYIKLLKE